MKRTPLRPLTLSALLLAVGLVLPFLTGQIPHLGKLLLPMHLPVFLCGLLCGWHYGLAVGLVLPLLRSALFGMPLLFPTALSMSLELATYGALSGLLYSRSPWQCIRALYRALVTSMLAGRIVLCAAEMTLLNLFGSGFVWSVFLTTAFLQAIPGVLLQLTLIPALMLALDRTGLVRFRRHHPTCPRRSPS